MKRRWIIETTGEERQVGPGEYYYINGRIDRWPDNLADSFSIYLVLKIAEICLDHSKALPCRYCEEIAEEYRQAMSKNKNMGD